MTLMSRGRKPGYKHSEETKDKIKTSLQGVPHSEERKENIRRSLVGTPHPIERRDNIAIGKSLYELDEKCLNRFEDLKSNYPEQEEFFVENRDELLFAMRDVRTEKELSDIRRYIETTGLRSDEPYQYSSSSCYAAEDAMIALLDFKRLLQRYH